MTKHDDKPSTSNKPHRISSSSSSSSSSATRYDRTRVSINAPSSSSSSSTSSSSSSSLLARSSWVILIIALTLFLSIISITYDHSNMKDYLQLVKQSTTSTSTLTSTSVSSSSPSIDVLKYNNQRGNNTASYIIGNNTNKRNNDIDKYKTTVNTNSTTKPLLRTTTTSSSSSSSSILSYMTNGDGNKNNNNIWDDVSVIITSSLIPNHPNIDIINETIHSLRYLRGLSSNVSIYVTIDALPDDYDDVILHKKKRKRSKKTKRMEERQKKEMEEEEIADDGRNRLAEYIRRLQNYYAPKLSSSSPSSSSNSVIPTIQQQSQLPFTNIHILPSKKYLHIAGSVNWIIQEYVTTKYVYVLQHDLAFDKAIDHQYLILLMEQYPNLFRNVRFRLGLSTYNRFPPCYDIGKKNFELSISSTNPSTSSSSEVEQHSKQLQQKFFATATWSDNNQLSTKSYYIEMMKMLKMLRRPMEGPMMHHAKKNCKYWGQIIYGGRYEEESYLKHLDGRHSKSYHSTTVTRNDTKI